MKEKIMIVDDDKNIIFAFRKTFEKDGFTVLSATSGSEALEKLKEEKPAIVFLDVAMPGLNGLEVLKEFNRWHSDIPVIIITGYGSMQVAIQAVQLGAYEYLTKPLDVEKVRITAKRALETVRLKQEVQDLKKKFHRPF